MLCETGGVAEAEDVTETVATAAWRIEADAMLLSEDVKYWCLRS